MRRDQWHASADDFSTVNLKGIGDIIAIDLEGDSDACVNESIDPQLCLWVVSASLPAMNRLPKTHSCPSKIFCQYRTRSSGESDKSAIIIATASPLNSFNPNECLFQSHFLLHCVYRTIEFSWIGSLWLQRCYPSAIINHNDFIRNLSTSSMLWLSNQRKWEDSQPHLLTVWWRKAFSWGCCLNSCKVNLENGNFFIKN